MEPVAGEPAEVETAEGEPLNPSKVNLLKVSGLATVEGEPAKVSREGNPLKVSRLKANCCMGT